MSPSDHLPRPLARHATLLSLVALAACATRAPEHKPEPANSAEPAPAAQAAQTLPALASPQAAANFYVLSGELAAGRGESAMGAALFLKALQIAPDADLAGRATHLAVQSQRADLAEQAARIWLKADPAALEAREVLLQVALRSNNADEAYSQAEAIVQDYPGGIGDGFHYLGQLSTQAGGDPQTLLTVLNRLITRWPEQAGGYAARALLDVRVKDYSAAQADAREALKRDPQSRDARLLLTDALIRTDHLQDAQAVVDQALKNSKDPASIRLSYARLLVDASKYPAAEEQLRTVLAKDPDNTDALRMLGVLSLNDGHVDEATKLFNKLATKPESAQDAAYFLGRIAEQQQKWQVALDEFSQVTSGEAALDAAVRRAGILGVQLKDVAGARQIFEQIAVQYPPLAERMRLAEGALLEQTGHTQDAYDFYTDLLASNPDNADLLYARALTGEKLGKTSEAETDLRGIIKQLPDDPRSLNALGYMLLEHDSSRLSEAETLIRHALQFAPNDPAVVDSMGWVLFKSGHPADALPWLQKAYASVQDPEIASHLGQVLWALDQKPQALGIWQDALKQHPDDAALQQLLKQHAP